MFQCIGILVNFAPMKADWELEIEACLQCLDSGGVLLYPTDTIWGLGCDPRNGEAVKRLFELKGRPADKSLILLASSLEQVRGIAGEVPELILEESLSARPTTVVYPSSTALAPGVAAADGSVAIRIAQDPFCKALTAAFGMPITSTSANLSGQAFAGSFADVAEPIVAGADYVVRWRQAEKISAQPSRILKLSPDGKVQVLRP